MARSTGPRSIRDDLERILGSFRRGLAFWKRSVVLLVLCVAATFGYVLKAPRTYTSETVVLYQEALRSSDLPGGGDRGTETARRVGARLHEVLFSRVVLEPLVTELGLFPDIVARRGLVDAVDAMRKHITFKPREGDTFEVSYEAESPQRAQEITHRLAECIVQEAAARRAEQAKTLKEFLDAESERNKGELKTKEEELARFLSNHPEFAKATPGDLRAAPARSTSPALAGGDAMLSALEWKAGQLERRLKAGDGSPVVAPPPAPTKLPDSAELVAARKDAEDKSAHYTDKHPDVIAARARLRSAESAQEAAQATADQAAKSAAATQEPPATSANREALTKELADLRQQAAARRKALGAAAPSPVATTLPSADAPNGAVGIEVEFRRLQRETNDARERQRALDERQFTANIATNAVMNDRNITVSVLDPAYLPTHPSSRPRSVMAGIGIALSLLLAFGTAAVSVMLDDRLYDRSDIEGLDLMPVLIVVPSPKALPGSRRG